MRTSIIAYMHVYDAGVREMEELLNEAQESYPALHYMDTHVDGDEHLHAFTASYGDGRDDETLVIWMHA
jgi:hypothetical protein